MLALEKVKLAQRLMDSAVKEMYGGSYVLMITGPDDEDKTKLKTVGVGTCDNPYTDWSVYERIGKEWQSYIDKMLEETRKERFENVKTHETKEGTTK